VTGPPPGVLAAAIVVVGAGLAVLARGSRAAWAAFLAFDVAAVALTPVLGLRWWVAAAGALGALLLLTTRPGPPGGPGRAPARRGRW